MLDVKQDREFRRISHDTPPSGARAPPALPCVTPREGPWPVPAAPLLMPYFAPPVTPSDVAPIAARLSVPAVGAPRPRGGQAGLSLVGMATPSPCFSLPQPTDSACTAVTSHPCRGPTFEPVSFLLSGPVRFSGAVRDRRCCRHRFPRPASSATSSCRACTERAVGPAEGRA